MNNRTNQIVTSLIQADFLVMIRNRRTLILGIALPLIVLFSSKNAAQLAGGGDYLLAICITLGLVSMGIFGYALSVARDRDKGIFQRLRVTPAPTWAIMTSRLVVAVAGCLIMAAVVLGVGTQWLKVSFGTPEYLLLAMSTVIGAAVFLSIGQAIVGIVKSVDAVNAVGRIVYIALFLLGAFGSTGALGTGMQRFAKWSPYGTVTAILNASMHPSIWSHDTTFALLACLGYVIVFAGVGIKWFNWSSNT